MPAKPTQLQKDEAKVLHRLYQEWRAQQRKAKLPYSQDHAGAQLGFSQSTMSQYLNGQIPLNVPAANRFAKLIGCQVKDFSPTLAAQVDTIVQDAPSGPRLVLMAPAAPPAGASFLGVARSLHYLLAPLEERRRRNVMAMLRDLLDDLGDLHEAEARAADMDEMIGKVEESQSH